jgi:hypothetical protein
MQTTRSTDYWKSMVSVYIKGFQKAQELLASDRMFTLEDIMLAFNNGYSQFTAQTMDCEDYIQSLSQPKSWEIEIEIEYKDGFGYWYDYTPMIQECNKEPFALRPKLTNGKIKITKIL